MNGLTLLESVYLGICLEGFFYGKIIPILQLLLNPHNHYPNPGLYSALFVIYLKYEACKQGMDNLKRTVLFYPLCTIYLFSVALVTTDMAGYILVVGKNSLRNNNNLFSRYPLSRWSTLKSVYSTACLWCRAYSADAATLWPSLS